MKKFIREMLDDLQEDKSSRDFIPPVPAAPTDGKTEYLDPPPQPVVPEDLEDQDLSCDQAEEVRQLDFQAQQDEERETLE
jgi:hypothetical protein